MSLSSVVVLNISQCETTHGSAILIRNDSYALKTLKEEDEEGFHALACMNQQALQDASDSEWQSR